MDIKDIMNYQEELLAETQERFDAQREREEEYLRELGERVGLGELEKQED